MKLLALLAASLALALPAQASPRENLDFNAGWRLQVGDPTGAQEPSFDDAGWKPVTLPRAWNEDEAFKKDIRELSTGIAWYRKRFTVPVDVKAGKAFIEFEGLRQAGEVWLNGQRLGLHENGITAFGFDITNAVKPAPAVNVIAVRTDNSWSYREQLSGAGFQWSDRNFNANYGGLSKKLRLHLTDKVYQTLPLYSHLGSTGVYVYAKDFDIAGRSATLHAESEIRNESTAPRRFSYQVQVKDADGQQVAAFDGGRYTLAPRESITARASARVNGLNFWSWGYGYLYTVTTSLVDEKDGAIFDSIATRTGFRKTEFANGMVKLNDRAMHIKGYAQRSSNEWPAIGLSVPAWLSDYSNGLMVDSGANLVRWMHIAPWKQDVESLDRVGLMQMLPAGDSERDAQGRSWVQRIEVMRDAIIYFRNNPSVLVYESGNNGISEAHMAEMKALRDRFDPHGGRAAGSRDMLGSREAEYGGEMLYVNKSARQPMWQTEYSRDEGARKFWDNFSPPFHKDGDGPLHNGQDASVYNRNQDTHAIENVVRWYDFWRERPGTGTRVNGGALNIIFSDSNTHHRGAENYRRSGEVDAMRTPKDGFYAHQVMWDGWVDVERARSHILGHWNYAPGTVKDVTVISSADSVELFLNGKSLGRGAQSSRFLFTFKQVAWQPGLLRAVGFDAKGRKLSEAQQQTVGKPVALKLSRIASPHGLRADGADLALLQVEVVDVQGRRHPLALDTVDFTLSGPAEWRGGIAQGPDNFVGARQLPVEGGVNRVLVRSSVEAGRIVVTAKAEGLKPAQIAFDSLTVTGEVALPGRLDRGPTPATAAFKPSRIAVPVVKATAEGTDDPRRAIDDDETTAWSGSQPISFELARVARLSEITLKTAGFRARSYPLRITVDGQEVFRGATPRSLGYVTLALKPSQGSKVTIETLGGSEARDAFAGITELVDQKNATTGEQLVSKGQLGLLEIEFYERTEQP